MVCCISRFIFFEKLLLKKERKEDFDAIKVNSSLRSFVTDFLKGEVSSEFCGTSIYLFEIIH